MSTPVEFNLCYSKTTMNQLRYIKIVTPDGSFFIIIDEHDVALASGFGPIVALATRLPMQFHDAELVPVRHHPHQQLVQRYYAGDSTALTKIPRNIFGTPFQKSVWRAMENIPYGEAKSYQQIAHHIKKPAAVRAVGTACGANRLALLIPCHRVVKSDGHLGSYFYGTDIKASLLQHEGALL